ncbi:MAG: hypothetical protein RLZZ238_1530, partial [Planctomycetota bacterium]
EGLVHDGGIGATVAGSIHAGDSWVVSRKRAASVAVGAGKCGRMEV